MAVMARISLGSANFAIRTATAAAFLLTSCVFCSKVTALLRLKAMSGEQALLHVYAGSPITY